MAHDPFRLTVARTAARHLAGVFALGLFTAFLAWLPASPAAAHGDLVSSDPPADGVLTALPSRAFLTFSDSITEVREIAVSGPDGSVTNGEPTVAGAEVQQTLWAGPAGTYTMEYFVVSADGHDVRGQIRFEVGLGASASESDVTAGESGASAAAGTGTDWRQRGRDVALPGGVVMLAAMTALALLHRRRERAEPG
ncbi:hypothetical protein GCM10009641_45340 [Mycobacterium cookii]|uniref:CopC domain-containing protein n=1 Tax=Nocardioides furvisabuli TaxID=375542 RepID=A0ABP5JK85_9ACTN|nr:copper resistance CopC family protein [Nocardioides furvisabuli]